MDFYNLPTRLARCAGALALVLFVAASAAVSEPSAPSVPPEIAALQRAALVRHRSGGARAVARG